jgi:hypothetical protein
MSDDVADDATPPAPSPLAYARPLPPDADRPPHPLPVVLYCVPGLPCWLTLGSMLLTGITARGSLLFDVLGSGLSLLFIVCRWGAAIGTAAASLIR